MKFKENDHQILPKERNGLSLSDVDSFFNYMNGLREELESKVKRLPEVDQEGNSECEFAEALYAEKEAFAEKVEEESQKLKPYLEIVQGEIERCLINLAQINTDGNSLFLDQAKENYDRAKRAQELQYEKVIRQRESLIGLIAWVAKTLAEARSKKFPGRKPQKIFRPPLGVLDGWGKIGSANEVASKNLIAQPSFKPEIESLISLGPLGKKNV